MISYIYFLIDFMNKKTAAFEQFYNLKNSSGWDLNTHLIVLILSNVFNQDEANNRKKSSNENMGQISKLAVERYNLELMRLMERASTELVYLYETILDDNPRMEKINSGIETSQKWISGVIEYYKENKTTLDKSSQCLITFGIFLKDILNQERHSEKVIKRALTMRKKDEKGLLGVENITNLTDITRIDTPVFIIRFGNSKRRSKVVDCNLSFCSKIGYLKSELMELEIDDIFVVPLKKRLPLLVGRLSKEGRDIGSGHIMVFKKRNGYSGTCLLTIKHHVAHNDQVFLICQCSFEKIGKSSGHLVVNKTGKILSHGSGVLDIFNITNGSFLEDLKIKNIKQLLDLESHQLPYLVNKKARVVKVKPIKKPKRKKSIKKLDGVSKSKFSIWQETKINVEQEEAELEIRVSKSQILGREFFLIQLTRNPDYKLQRESIKLLSRYKIHHSRNRFYFRYDINELGFSGAFNQKFKHKRSNVEVTECLLGTKTGLSDIQKCIYEILNRTKETRENEMTFKTQFKDYGVGIRVKRLNRNGNLMDYFEDMDDMDSELIEKESEYRKKSSLFATKKLETFEKKKILKTSASLRRQTTDFTKKSRIPSKKNYLDPRTQKFENNMINKKKIKKLVKNQKIPFTIKCLIFQILLFSFLYGVCYYFIIKSRTSLITDIQANTMINYAIFFRVIDLGALVTNLIDINLNNNGTDFELNLPDYQKKTKGRRNNDTMDAFKENLELSTKWTKGIDEEIMRLSDRTQYEEFFNAKNVTIMRSANNTKNYTFNQAMMQTLSTAVLITTKDPDTLNFWDKDYLMLNNNIFHSLLQAQIELYHLNVIFRNSILDRMNSEMKTIQYLGLALYAYILIALYTNVMYFLMFKEKFADVFFDFDPVILKSCVKQNDNFIQYLQLKKANEEENLEIRDSDSRQFEEEIENKQKNQIGIMISGEIKRLGRKKRKGTLVKKIGKIRFVFFLVITLFVEFGNYFIINRNEEVREKAGTLDSIEKIAAAPTFSAGFLNSFQMSLYDPRAFYNRMPAAVAAGFYIRISLMQNDRALNATLNSYMGKTEFNNAYEEIFNQDACQAYKKYSPDKYSEEEEKSCYLMFGGLMKKGFAKVSVAFLDEIQNFQNYATYYREGVEEKEWLFPGQGAQGYEGLPKSRQYLKSLLSTKEFRMLKELQERYMNTLYRVLSKKSIEYIIDGLQIVQNASSLDTILTMGLLLVLTLQGVVWIYSYGRFEVRKVSLIDYLPLRLILKNKKLMRYLEDKDKV